MGIFIGFYMMALYYSVGSFICASVFGNTFTMALLASVMVPLIYFATNQCPGTSPKALLIIRGALLQEGLFIPDNINEVYAQTSLCD